MACNDGLAPLSDEEAKEIRMVAATLCGIAKVLEDQNFLSKILTTVDWNDAGVSRADFEAWWAEHKIADSERKRRERAEQRQVELMKQAAAKLTPDELAALKGRWREMT